MRAILFGLSIFLAGSLLAEKAYSYGNLSCGGPGEAKFPPGSVMCFGGFPNWQICSGISDNRGDPNNANWTPTSTPCNQPAPRS